MVLLKEDPLFCNFKEIMDDWTAQLDSGGQVDVIYTDFAKAFDTVPH